jgi:hypothetical protein
VQAFVLAVLSSLLVLPDVRDGREIAAHARTEVRSGDLLRTAPGSTAQLRLQDNALIALRQGTEFRIEDFRYAGKEDGTERAFFRLLKGGFRTVSGAIGHVNPGNYEVRTDAATLGIRGTHYNLVLCRGDCPQAKDGLYGGVLEGRVAVANQAKAEQLYGAGEFFHVADYRSPAERLLTPPSFLHDKLAVRPSGSASSAGVAAAAELQAHKQDAKEDRGWGRWSVAVPLETLHAPGKGSAEISKKDSYAPGLTRVHPVHATNAALPLGLQRAAATETAAGLVHGQGFGLSKH